MSSKTVSLAFALFGAVVPASAVELVTNGDFQTQDSSGVYGAGWSVTSTAGYDASEIFDNWSTQGFTDAPNAVTAFLGYDSDNTDTITQGIDTTGYSAATLTVTFTSDGFDDPTYDFMDLTFGGQTIDHIDVGSVDGSPFTKTVSYDLSSMFTGGTKSLGVSVALDDSFDTWVWVQNVSIAATPVPEPASMAALGLGAAAMLRRRRRTC